MKIIKEIFIICVFPFAFVKLSTAQNQGSIDKQKAWEIVKEYVLKNELKDINVYISKNVFATNQELEKIRNINSPSYSSWFFFIDERPYQNLAHPCKYCFINSSTGEFEIIKSDSPPNFDNIKVEFQISIE